MASHNIPNSIRLVEAALVVFSSVPGYAHNPEYINEVAPTSHVEVYNGPIPSERAVRELHRFLGLVSISSAVALHAEVPSSGSDECPPPGYPEQTELVYLNGEPLCYNNSLTANPFNNRYICPNSTKNAGRVYDMNDPQGYAQCNTRMPARPTAMATSTPEPITLDLTEDTPSSSSAGAPLYGIFLGLAVASGLLYAGLATAKRKH